jgi:hypothetical protein
MMTYGLVLSVKITLFGIVLLKNVILVNPFILMLVNVRVLLQALLILFLTVLMMNGITS